MKVIVKPHNIELIKEESVNEREINISKCTFEFDERITDEFTKEAYFTLNGRTYKKIIINNECDYPSEILSQDGEVELGVVAFYIDENENETRFNPTPKSFYTMVGSLKDNAENSEPITPSEMEQYEQALQDGLTEVNSKLDDIDQALTDVNTAITKTNNLDLDVSKEGKVATVTLTKKDASTKVVTLSDGTSLMFNWQGTSLGIKTDEDEDYTYVDLQGIQGETGPMGAPFTVKKTYSSVAEMNADFNNMQVGDYVMITSSVEVEDNAKLYSRGTEAWIFITDFSGATGIQGPVGATPNIQIGTVVQGSSMAVTRTGTNENPIFNFTLVKGDTGNTGATGNGISSIVKTSTSGYVDTYTITYTNGTTSTFDVTNGEVSQEVFDALERKVECYKKYSNALVKQESNSATSLTINNTEDCPMKLELSPSELEQETTTGTNYFNASVITSSNVTVTDNGKTITMPIASSGNGYVYIAPNTFKSYVPNVQAGDVLYLFFDRNLGTTYNNYIYLRGSSTLWENGTSHTITQTELDDGIYLYGNNYNQGETQQVILSNFRMVKNASDEWEKFTNNQSAPNPDYPQDIHTITGDNEITISNNDNTKSQTFPLTLGNLEYCKIGDYADKFFKNTIDSEEYNSTLELNKWYLKKNIGKVVLNGSEEDWINDGGGAPYKYTIDNIKNPPNNAYAEVYCDNFLPVPYNDNWNNYNYLITRPQYNSTNKGIKFRNVDISTLNDFKIWLSTHNTVVYYVLATPTYTLLNSTLQEQLDNLQLALSHKDQTNVSQVNNDLPFLMKATTIVHVPTKVSELTNDSGYITNSALTNVAYKNTDNNFSANQTINGNLQVNGNITNTGSSYETHAEKVYTKNDYIVTRDGAVSSLASGDYTGFQAKLYDGTNDGRLVFDNTGTARVGDIGDEVPLLARDEATNMTNNYVMTWDSTNLVAKTSFGVVTLTQAQYDALVTKDSNTYYMIVEE